MKKYLIEIFLRSKNMKFNECNTRQKEILKKESRNMWDMYTWNI